MNIIDELTKEGLFLENGNMNPSFSKRFFTSITPDEEEWYNSLLGSSFSERIYLEVHSISTLPQCPICGKPLKFISYKEGYREFCSNKCRGLGTAAKASDTCKKRYGVARPAQSKVIQAKMKKTTKERYGVDNIFQCKDKIQDSFKKKYNVDNPMFIEEFRDKMIHSLQTNGGKGKDRRKQTNLAKYGSACSLHGSEVQKSIRNKLKERYIKVLFESDRIKQVAIPRFSMEEYRTNIDSEGQVILYPWTCIKCNSDFEDYIANGKIPRCPKCYPPAVQGIMEKELVIWLRSLLPNENIIENSRRIISPWELDVYLPKYKLAIEFNEIYWHSELATQGKRGSDYHITKTKACESQGIRLIHIFDSEWYTIPEIVKSVIKATLNIFSSRIGARKGEIRRISSHESSVFLEANHLQGFAPSSIRYGLFYNGELVAHLALGKNRFLPNTYEIVRYVSKINTQVQGGLSRLWKEAKKNLSNNTVLVSYVDLRFFRGKSNLALGLNFDHTNPPSFYYTKDYKTLHNRLEFQKHKLNKKLQIFDPELTEWENMQLNGYDRIWDCGTAVYTMKL